MVGAPKELQETPQLARCLSSQRSKYDAAAFAVFMGSSGPDELGKWDDVLGITTSGIRYYWSGVSCQLPICRVSCLSVLSANP